MGEAEDVFSAATDHRDFRSYLFNQGGAAGAVAPVMRNEEHFALKIDPGMNQMIFDTFRDIRRQQKPDLAEGEPQGEGVVVGLIKNAGSGPSDGWRGGRRGHNGRRIRRFLSDGHPLRI